MAEAGTLLAQDSTALYKKAGHLFLEAVAGAIRERGRAVVAFSGGTTPKKFFELLAEPSFRDRIDWSKLHIFWVDERSVPPQHPESNFGMTQAALLSKVPISTTNIHRIPGEMSSPQEAARAYENELKSFFKLTLSPPQFDWILLGVGEDGHTASLFPRTEALNEKDHWVTATTVEKTVANRITLTFPVLNNARQILFLLSGPSKAEILKMILATENSQPKVPAQMVRPTSGQVTWLFDKAAASKLPPEVRFKAFHL